MKALLVRSVLVLTCVPCLLSAQTSTWVQVATTGPSARELHGLAFDAMLQRTVLFGGELHGAGTGFGGDTWAWDGAAWAQLAAPGPSARSGLAIAYDSLRQRTVLFGGFDGNYRGDTWELSNSTWIPQILAVGPSPRRLHAMAFDSARGRVVLFGGQGTGGGWLSDTWEWDGATWHLAAAGGPAARGWHAMAYDSQRGCIVLFGGAYAQGGPSIFLGDTLEWDGAVWWLRSTSGPSPRAGHAMSYDAQRGLVLVTGGLPAPSGGLWGWDGTDWTRVGPGLAREGARMVYDSHRGRPVVFGGNLSSTWFSDTLELVATLAGGTPFGTGCGTPPLALAGVPTAPPSLGTTAQAAITSSPSALAFVALGVSNTTFGPFSLPVSLASIGMPGCDLLQSTEVVGEPTTPTGVGTANYSFAIPNNTALIGFHLYLQAWAWAPGANPANIIVSNGLDWRVGL